MDKAFWDTMRWDHFRWDVSDPKWDEGMDVAKKQPARSGGGIDPFVTGSWRTGHVRTSVYIPRIDEIIDKLKKG